RDRDGNRIQNRVQGQQENKGRYDQGQHEYRGRQDQSVEHRGYDSKRQDFRGQDQRFAGRNGNDRPGISQLGILTRVMLQVLQVRGGLLRLCLLHLFVLPRGQATKTSGTITGTLYIDDRTVFILFDTGATHSIISTTFAKKLNMTLIRQIVYI
ncbi:zinc finger, CCHC-type, retrotransposon gag domain protein, partial [Tanacetum coccineum]